MSKKKPKRPDNRTGQQETAADERTSFGNVFQLSRIFGIKLSQAAFWMEQPDFPRPEEAKISLSDTWEDNELVQLVERERHEEHQAGQEHKPTVHASERHEQGHCQRNAQRGLHDVLRCRSECEQAGQYAEWQETHCEELPCSIGVVQHGLGMDHPGGSTRN